MSDTSKEDELIAKLRIIIKGCATDPIDLSNFSTTTKVQEIGLDSLTILDMFYDIEQETGISIEQEELVDFRTVGDITTLLINKGA